MPDSGIPAPYLDPSQYPGYLDMQRKQMLAQMLMQNVGQVGQTPQSWDSMRLTPKTGLLQGIAPVAAALLASKGMKNSMKAQQDYFQGLYGSPQAGAAPPQTGASSGASTAPAAPNAVPGGYAPSGLVQPQSLAQGAPQPSPAPGNPLLAGLDPHTAQALMGIMGPETYGKEIVAPQFKPAEIVAQIRAAGIDPRSPQGLEMARAALSKGTTNIENVRPGGTLFDVARGGPIFSAPQNGVNTTWGPNGPVQSVLPGAPQAQSEMTGAETAGKTMNTPQAIPTQGGGTRYAYPADAIGLPPALRGAGQPRASGASSAPPMGAPANTAAVPSAGGGAVAPIAKPATDAWTSMPKLKIGTAVGAPDAFTEGRLKAAGGKDAELSSKYGEESNLADQKMQYNTDAMKLLSQAETGPSSEWLTENRAKLLEWGVPESLVPGDKSVTPTLELNKVLKQSALQGARAIFGSRMTQMEVRLQHEELSPSTSMTKDAISSLIQQDNIKSQYAKQRADDYGKFVEQGGDPLRFESWYSRQFPLTKFAQTFSQQNPSVPAGQKAAPAPRPGLVSPNSGVSDAKPWEMNWK